MQEFKADVAVLSAGTAGLPAAVTAAENGASVVVLEKTGHTGGAGNMANDIFGVESEYQKQFSPYLTLDEAFKTQMDWTHYRVDPKLVMTIFRNSGSTIDWLHGHGIDFFSPDERPKMPGMPEGPTGTLTVKGEAPGASRMGQFAFVCKTLTKKAEDLGVKFLLKTPAKSLIKEGGRITGVMAETLDGEEVRVQADAVIIATGGFSDNKEMLKKYTGYEEGKNIVFLYKTGITGDGIRMAWEAGAASSPMMVGLTHHLPPPCCGGGGTSREFTAFTQPENIFVNLLGERFQNDDIWGSHGVAGAHGTVASVIALQREKVAFMILDENLKNMYAEREKARPKPKMPQYELIFKHDDLEDNIKEAISTGYEFLFIANGLEDLCAQTGINLEGLKKTLEDYNSFCEKGKDEQFNKDSKYLKSITGPKFYVGKFIAGGYGTSGGIKINHKMEVVNEEMEPIPGLYAAGNDANNMYDHSYTPLSGNHIGFAVNSGRIAAESAAEYVKTFK